MANEPLDPAPPDINDLLKSLQPYAPPAKATRPKPLASALAVIGDALTALGGRQPQGVQNLVAGQERHAAMDDESAARNVQMANQGKILGFEQSNVNYRSSLDERRRQRAEQQERDRVAQQIMVSEGVSIPDVKGNPKLSGHSVEEVSRLSQMAGVKKEQDRSYARRKSILDDAARGVKAAPEELTALEATYPGITNDAAILISKAKLGKFQLDPSDMIRMAAAGVDVGGLVPPDAPPEFTTAIRQQTEIARFNRSMQAAVARLNGFATQAKDIDPTDPAPDKQLTIHLAAAAQGLLPFTASPQEPEMLVALYTSRLKTMSKNILNGQMDPQIAIADLSAFKKMLELFPGVAGLIADPKEELAAVIKTAGKQQPLGESKNTVLDPINAPPDSSRYLKQEQEGAIPPKP